ncbi:hypothetical protein QL285_074528 [Trifolium repens]|nr:hypothetical protein QL285_074528 [Trifolium repens]
MANNFNYILHWLTILSLSWWLSDGKARQVRKWRKSDEVIVSKRPICGYASQSDIITVAKRAEKTKYQFIGLC